MATKRTINTTVFNYDKGDFPTLTKEQVEALNKVTIIFGDTTKIIRGLPFIFNRRNIWKLLF